MSQSLIIDQVIKQIVQKISTEIDANKTQVLKDVMKKKLEDWATKKTSSLKEQAIIDGKEFRVELSVLEKEANDVVRYGSVGKYGEGFW